MTAIVDFMNKYATELCEAMTGALIEYEGRGETIRSEVCAGDLHPGAAEGQMSEWEFDVQKSFLSNVYQVMNNAEAHPALSLDTHDVADAIVHHVVELDCSYPFVAAYDDARSSEWNWIYQLNL